MRSMSVPCGTRSTFIEPAIICFWVSGFSPMWLAIAVRDKAGVHELADAAARHCGVVGDHREIALALAHELVDQPLRACRRP